MAWRTFAVFLLALNLAAFTFAWLNPKPAPPAPSATEANVTTLVLLSERDAEQMRAAAQAAGAAPSNVRTEAAAMDSQTPLTNASPTAPAGQVASADPATLNAQYCERIGPIREAEVAASLRARLGTLSAAAEVKEVEEMQIRGYWVYLPPSTDREAALALAKCCAR